MDPAFLLYQDVSFAVTLAPLPTLSPRRCNRWLVRLVASRRRVGHRFAPMNQEQNLDELLSCRLEFGRKAVEPCTIVIFGASGDLTARKLIPALYHLFAEKQLPSPFQIIGFARREKTDEGWRAELFDAFKKFSRSKQVPQATWNEFAAN